MTQWYAQLIAMDSFELFISETVILTDIYERRNTRGWASHSKGRSAAQRNHYVKKDDVEIWSFR